MKLYNEKLKIFFVQSGFCEFIKELIFREKFVVRKGFGKCQVITYVVSGFYSAKYLYFCSFDTASPHNGVIKFVR